MYTCPIQLDDVRYNAAAQQFEASVRVHDNTILRTYACAIAAPISLPFAQAAKGLAKQAIHRHVSRDGFFSQITPGVLHQPTGKRSVDPVRWLEHLMNQPERTAA